MSVQSGRVVTAASLILALFSLTVVIAGQELTDSMVKTIVEHRLIKKGLQKKDNIEVSVQKGVVTLKGTVASLNQKRRAEKAASGADGVSSVENQLRIDGGDVSDRQIAENIAREIRNFVFYDIFDWVQIEVRNGAVTLTGWVREPWRMQDYERLAQDIVGVVRVDNQIKKLSNSFHDDQIRVAAARAIYGHPSFRRYRNRSLPPIHIIVDDGRVRLEGAVATKLERQLAEIQVRNQTLSFEVINNLRVD